MALAHLLLGRVVVTPAALAALTQPDIVAALSRHAAGDWGEVDAEDRAANDNALSDRTLLLSAYTSAGGTQFWVITEDGWSVTTVLVADDY